MKKLKELKELIEDALEVNATTSNLIDLDDKFDTDNDFCFEIDGNEYRFISGNVIEDTYFDEQKDLIEECYLRGKELPHWIEIDWEKTIDNVLSSDGYGNHFASYDGSEESFGYEDELWYVFRIN